MVWSSSVLTCFFFYLSPAVFISLFQFSMPSSGNKHIKWHQCQDRVSRHLLAAWQVSFQHSMLSLPFYLQLNVSHVNHHLLQSDSFSGGTISNTSLETRNIGHTLFPLARKWLIFLKEKFYVNMECFMQPRQCFVLFSIYLNFLNYSVCQQ